MKQKRIAFFLGSMKRGGAERVISILSKEYAALGWNTDIGLLLFPDVEYQLDDSTRVYDFTGSISSRIKRVPHWLKSIRKYVKEQKPDVILSFAARINILVILACLGLHVKIVVSERNDPRYDGRGKIAAMLVNILYPTVSKIVFQTKQVQSLFRKRIQKNSVVIANPVSVAAERSETTQKRIVSMGRLSSQKNQKMLLSAFAEATENHPEYELVIYGEGPLREALTEQAKALCISERLHLPGNVLNVHEKIKDAEIFVLSSDYEGLSNALLEAMRMGFPCISTMCAGADEYIRSYENGILIPVGDKDAMRDAILYMMEHEEETKQMGKNSKETSNLFCAENVLSRWHQVLD